MINKLICVLNNVLLSIIIITVSTINILAYFNDYKVENSDLFWLISSVGLYILVRVHGIKTHLKK